MTHAEAAAECPNEVRFFSHQNRLFEPIGGSSGDIRVARDVGTEISTTIGCGVLTLANCSAEWTVSYDEYLYCLSGTLTLRTRQRPYSLTSGDAIWLPKGTWLVYEASDPAVVVYAVYPVNWRDQAKASATE